MQGGCRAVEVLHVRGQSVRGVEVLGAGRSCCGRGRRSCHGGASPAHGADGGVDGGGSAPRREELQLRQAGAGAQPATANNQIGHLTSPQPTTNFTEYETKHRKKVSGAATSYTIILADRKFIK